MRPRPSPSTAKSNSPAASPRCEKLAHAPLTARCSSSEKKSEESTRRGASLPLSAIAGATQEPLTPRRVELVFSLRSQTLLRLRTTKLDTGVNYSLIFYREAS